MPEVPVQAESQHVEFEEDGPFWTPRRRRGLVWTLVVLLVVVLLAVVPPLISINRYQRRVASSISGSLGRPVHFDNLTMHLLPLPGITIENFVVGESPEFGAEPVMRAQNVEARLRVGSIFRRRIEVSSINLESPSINLVRRRADGAWNLQGILMQASQMNSAPTAQAKAGPAPRFPYIEATDARINIKSDQDKLPFAIKEADVALWLPEPNEWHLRLSGKPVRTDTDVSDVGLVRVEATLGRAADLESAPIEMSASWKPTPLGEAAKIAAGRDLDWRGEAAAEATLKGTMGKAKLIADLHLSALRRADFVPEHTAEVNAHCEGTTGGLLRSLTDLRCAIPTNADTSMFAAIDFLRKSPTISDEQADGSAKDDAAKLGKKPSTVVKPGVLLIRGNIPNVLDWHSITVDVTLKTADPNYALAWARLFSKRIPRDLTVGGTLWLEASRSPVRTQGPAWSFNLSCACDLPEKDKLAGAKSNRWFVELRHPGVSGDVADGALYLSAYPAPPAGGPGGMIPPIPFANSVSGQMSLSGYTLLYGSRKMADLAASLFPPLGDGLTQSEDASGPLQSARAWNGVQTWKTPPAAARRPVARARRHN
jgi:AsmA protein